MSNRRTKNAIKESELPPPKARNREDHQGHLSPVRTTSRGIKDRSPRSESINKPTASELEEAQLLIGAAGSISEEQLVYLVNDESHIQNQVIQEQQQSQVQSQEQPPEPPQPQLTEEELQKELQALLDSQLEHRNNEDDESRHLIRNREQLEAEPDDEVDYTTSAGLVDTPSKGFTANEIQTFHNNQIRRQHHLQTLEDTFETHSSSQRQPHHLILVTQNGDKIILIQNPNELDDSDADLTGDYQLPEFTEEQERQLQAIHQYRQMCFVKQLDRLRELHQQRLHPSVTTPAVPHLQPIKLVPFPKSDSFSDDECGTEGGSEVKLTPLPTLTKSRPKQIKKATTTPKGVVKKEIEFPKWFKPIRNYLNLAVKYVRRREEKIEEVVKMFPQASSGFEKRCSDLKQDFLNIECAIERFQNTIGSQLEEATQKFHTLLKDYHLENSLADMEAEDEVDEFDSNIFDVDQKSIQPQQQRRFKKNVVTTEGNSTNIQIITPSNISITSATAEVTNNNNSQATADADESEDPFEFRQEPEPLVKVTPVTSSKSRSLNTPIIVEVKDPSNTNKDVNNTSPSKVVRSARLQTRKRTAEEPPIQPPSRSPSTRPRKAPRR